MSLRGGTNPFDLAGDVHAMARQDTAAREGVLAAMAVAGIPPGEPVLIAGHSQGGMVAASLAADPKVRARYHITHVVTVGSPVAGFRVPPDVQLLCVEHTDDAVPRLDGRPDPDRAGWVTVRRTVHDPGAPANALRAHDLDEYRRTMALVDRSTDQSLRAYRAGLEPFLDRPGATGWSNDVTLRRAAG
jgi:pimeloyl-ACP methyl ester carboxylesterase